MSIADQDHRHHPAEVGADVAEVAGGGLRAAEVGVAFFVGLLVCPPLLTLAVAVAVPMIAVAAVVGIVGSVFVSPILLVRHVRAPPHARIDAVPPPAPAAVIFAPSLPQRRAT